MLQCVGVETGMPGSLCNLDRNGIVLGRTIFVTGNKDRVSDVTTTMCCTQDNIGSNQGTSAAEHHVHYVEDLSMGGDQHPKTKEQTLFVHAS